MSGTSAIEWTDATWNPVVGCDPISPGCDNCYAQTLHNRRHVAWLAGRMPNAPEQYHLPFERVQLKPERLDDPARWRAPRRIFVNSVSDLFHEDVPFDFIDEVMAVAWAIRRHTFQILTKRPRRMLEWRRATKLGTLQDPAAFHENVWFGVSVELDRYSWRSNRYLAEMPAAVRFVSAEPLLGPLPSLGLSGVDWLIVGGESGTDARPTHPSWLRDLRERCQQRGAAYFFKQWGEWAQAERAQSTHLMHVGGQVVPRSEATMDHPYGERSGIDQDLVDRGHQGWVRMRRVGRKAAGRMLDGRTWDEFPTPAPVGVR